MFSEQEMSMLILTLISKSHYLTAPPMKYRERLYRVQIETGFTIRYAYGALHRMCVISQPRRLGDLRLSG